MTPEALAIADMLRSPDPSSHILAAISSTDDQFAAAFRLLFREAKATDDWRDYVGVTVFRSQCVDLSTLTDWQILTASQTIAMDISKNGRWCVSYRACGSPRQINRFKSIRGAALRIKKLLQE